MRKARLFGGELFLWPSPTGPKARSSFTVQRGASEAKLRILDPYRTMFAPERELNPLRFFFAPKPG